jgi:cytochrome bd ubiquinol oxidase subunit I
VDALDLSRWPFCVTTVYHFLFAPIATGTGFLVPGFETALVGTGRERWLRPTKFCRRLFFINFAIGALAGISSEFECGIKRSAYGRMVGNILGAPLAIGELLAFFLESTLPGLWVFGWERLSPRLRLACL